MTPRTMTEDSISDTAALAKVDPPSPAYACPNGRAGNIGGSW